jgi:predicted nucleotidyltransferase
MKKGLTEARISPPDLAEVRKLVLAGLRAYRAAVYLFGSWAAGKAGRTSDIDVAVLPLEPIPRHVFSEIREALEESCVIYKVDLVDLSDSSEEFRSRILSEGVLWSE